MVADLPAGSLDITTLPSFTIEPLMSEGASTFSLASE